MSDQAKTIYSHAEQVTFLNGDPMRVNVQGHIHTSNDEIRQHLIDERGADPDSIILNDKEDRKRQRNRSSIGSLGIRWNATWEPTGGNPNLN